MEQGNELGVGHSSVLPKILQNEAVIGFWEIVTFGPKIIVKRLPRRVSLAGIGPLGQKVESHRLGDGIVDQTLEKIQIGGPALFRSSQKARAEIFRSQSPLQSPHFIISERIGDA